MKKNPFNINAPKRISDNFGSSFIEILSVIKLLNELNVSPKHKISIDFTSSKFTGPFYLGPLSCLLRKYQLNGRKISIKNQQTYIDTVKFPDGYRITKNIDLSYFKKKTYIPIIHFKTIDIFEKDRNSIISTINGLLKFQLQLPISILQAFYYFIDELTQNIVDHSLSDYGTIFAQYYPTKNYLDLNICDSGRGIYSSYLNTNSKRPKSNAQAINFAVNGKSTKDIPESRGFGLSTTRKMLVNGLKGSFLLYSGNSFFIHTPDREEILTLNKDTVFKGCMINLRIPTFNIKGFNTYDFVEG